MNGMFAARREMRLLTSSNGWRYGICTMTKKACSNGSSMEPAVASIWLKHSEMSLRNFERVKSGFFDGDGDVPQLPAAALIC